MFPNAPKASCFPAMSGVTDGIAPVPERVDAARRDSRGIRRAAQSFLFKAPNGIFLPCWRYDSRAPLQAPLSALPWTQARQLGGPALNFVDPWNGQPNPFADSELPATQHRPQQAP